jgi:hypothetical protein
MKLCANRCVHDIGQFGSGMKGRMSKSSRPLDVIQVEAPCTVDWESMHGDDRVRFCSYCQRHVHNLSAVTEDEAARLICDQADRLCVRFSRDAKGRTATLDYQPTRKRSAGWQFWAFVGTAAAVCSWVLGVVGHGPGKPTVTMGEIAPPTTRGTTLPTFCPMVPPTRGSTSQPTTSSINDDDAL